MDSKIIIENILKNYNFINFPESYKNTLIEILDIAKEELKDNLLSITLGGSGGKNNLIKGWSDLDIYIILKRYNIKEITSFQEKISKSEIHIGTTFYNLYEIENNLIDFKSKIMIYEKNNYHVNPTLYGKDYFKNVTYQEVYNNDLENYPQTLQNFKRMYIEVLNNQRKIDKTYMKKMIVLIKCILSSYEIFSYGYDKVFNEFYHILNNSDSPIALSEIITYLENYEEYIKEISYKIIEFTETEELFKKTTTTSKIKKRLIAI